MQREVVGAVLTGLFALSGAEAAVMEAIEPAQGRSLPVAVYAPAGCAQHCPVLLMGTGYRIAATGYETLAQGLAEDGVLVLVLQHDLSGDAPMPQTGDILRDRGPFWARGVEALQVALRGLPARHPEGDWRQVMLAGHSQGGDIASLFATQHPERVRMLITLDNRRVPLPRRAHYPLLSLRSADQPADAAVLPAPADLGPGSCVRRMSDVAHDDMSEDGPPPARRAILDAVRAYLRSGRCPS